MKRDTIVVLDLGSRENQRLLDEIGTLGVACVLRPHTITAEELAAIPDVKGVIVNGGPDRMVDGVEMDVVDEVYNAPVPVLLADHRGDLPWPEDPEERRQTLADFVLGICGAEPCS